MQGFALYTSLGGVIQRCCKGSRIGLDLEALGRKRWYTRHQKPTGGFVGVGAIEHAGAVDACARREYRLTSKVELISNGSNRLKSAAELSSTIKLSCSGSVLDSMELEHEGPPLHCERALGHSCHQHDRMRRRLGLGRILGL